MDTDTARVQNRNVEQTHDDEKHRLLESCADAVRALKGFMAEYDRVKGERDHLKRQITGVHSEVDMLRKQVEQLKGQRDQLSNRLSTLTGHVESFASRCLEAVRKARLQSHSGRTGAPDESSRSSPFEETGVGQSHRLHF